MSVPTTTLNDGVVIPQLGFGTWQVPADEAEKAVSAALEAGFRHIDTAAIYDNEEGVGRALAASGLDRKDLFITTKLWNDAHHANDARKAIETSLSKLGLDHIDLYLIHWPAPVKYGDAYIEAWNALQDFKSEGLTRSIGVSNFKTEHLDAIEGVTPSVDQIEMHPTFNQATFRAELAKRGITEPAARTDTGRGLPPETLQALLRRAGNQVPLVRLGRLEFDTNTRMASVGGQPLALTPRELAVLEALLARVGRPVAMDRWCRYGPGAQWPT